MERKPFPSETQERFIVRFPDGMRDQIAEAAKANNRSMNAEIVARLQQSFDSSPVLAVDGKPLVSEDQLHALLEKVASATALELVHSLGEKGYLIEEISPQPRQASKKSPSPKSELP